MVILAVVIVMANYMKLVTDRFRNICSGFASTQPEKKCNCSGASQDIPSRNGTLLCEYVRLSHSLSHQRWHGWDSNALRNRESEVELGP
jgi:hypothetical protein